MKKNTALNKGPDLAENCSYDGLRRCYLCIDVDVSGSMSRLTDGGRKLDESIRETLTALAGRNKTAEDVEILVKLRTFADKLKEINNVFLPPEEVLDLLEDDTFATGGMTNLTAVMKAIDHDFSRTGELFRDQHHKGDPQPIQVLITDNENNVGDFETARSQLLDNRLFSSNTVRLCVYLGNDKGRRQMEELVGGRQNLVSLTDQLDRYLTPVLLNSTINLTQVTHLGGSGDTATTASIADEVCQREEAGRASAADLQDSLKQLFQGL